jgi:hypothetical protein
MTSEINLEEVKNFCIKHEIISFLFKHDQKDTWLGKMTQETETGYDYPHELIADLEQLCIVALDNSFYKYSWNGDDSYGSLKLRNGKIDWLLGRSLVIQNLTFDIKTSDS